MSPKSRPKSPPSTSATRSGGGKKSPGAEAPATRVPTPAPKRRVPRGWLVFGGVVVTAVAIGLIAAFAGGGGSSPSGGAGVPASAELVRNTEAANVPLLDAEGVATHTHTTLRVVVDGTNKQVPALIGIDPASGKIAALHTHDTSGLVHLESAKENDSYTLDQFLTVWGVPKDAAGRCAFFGAKSPCTLAVKSEDSGTVGLDVPLKDYDTLTLTVTSS